ncbi:MULTISPECIES: DoxX-like family protein [Pseudomonas]|uniref:DoxX-like family protein n=1 Tax=Pseudomonas TaxID=286 RepID=UPI001C2F6D3E|nr:MULTISPECIES: DoxX-like family protein [Pseudomonas]MBV2081583.1 DoxX-like family protein [Pseudomonas carnis]MBV2086314.1 DoxX-like family protein [Pseudomonas carnis]MDO3689895.1 DoxX-like family protein [Pseudomonas sp. DKN 2791]MDO7033920.1 DoxX-like family protein [Pseudomonas sp. DKN 2792]
MNPLLRINWIARGGLAFMFAYHGLVPKLLWLSQGERAMIQAHGIEQVQLFATLAGVAEIALAIWILLSPRSARPLVVAATALAGLLVDVAVFSPSILREAFNPVSLNVAGLALCAVAWNIKP